MNKIAYIAASIAAMFLVSCHSHGDDSHSDHEGAAEAHGHEEAEEAHDHSGDGIIELTDAEATRFGITYCTASEAEIAETVKLPATIVSSESTPVTVTAAKSGRLTWKSSLHEGMKVGPGTPLATISGTSVTGGDADAATLVSLRAVEREIERVKPLVADGIVPRKDFIALENEAERLRKLSTTASGASTVTSPAAGIITAITAGNGSNVNPGDQLLVISPAATSGNLIRVDLPRRYFSKIAAVKSADITLDNGTLLTAPLRSEATVADPSGFIPLYFGPVASENLVAGSSVEAAVAFGGASTHLALPRESVNEQEGVYSVFVKLSPGHYRRTPVTIGVADSRSIEITGGITPADTVVAEGTIYLRLAETRANAPQGHSHNH